MIAVQNGNYRTVEALLEMGADIHAVDKVQHTVRTVQYSTVQYSTVQYNTLSCLEHYFKRDLSAQSKLTEHSVSTTNRTAGQHQTMRWDPLRRRVRAKGAQ